MDRIRAAATNTLLDRICSRPFQDGWLSELIDDCLGTRCMGKDLENLRDYFLKARTRTLHLKSCLLIMVLKVIKMMKHDREHRTEIWSMALY